MAADADLDLVEVAGQAEPPVCRIMDYGKYKYEMAVKQKEARKKQSQIVVKEMKMRPKIDRHDYETKKGHVVRFLRQGAKVKITIMFRGREMSHMELGRKLLDRLAEDVVEIAKIEAFPKVDGRNMTMVLSPLKEAITARPAYVPKHERPRPEAPVAEGGETADEPEPAVPVDGPADEPVAEVAEEEPVAASKAPPKVTRAEGG
jgi:translation initiation factor IF-3